MDQVLGHRKQGKIKVGKGKPSMGTLTEHLPELRLINNKMYLCVKAFGKIYYLRSTEILQPTTNFDLHASSHENGGGDEISIAGLSGTPAALTIHEADTSTHGVNEIADNDTVKRYSLLVG